MSREPRAESREGKESKVAAQAFQNG